MSLDVTNSPQPTFKMTDSVRQDWLMYGQEWKKVLMFVVFDPIEGHYPFYLSDEKDRNELYEAYESDLPQPKETILEEWVIKSKTRLK